VLTGVTFHVDPGEFVFITGKSGAGKTTLMRLLTRQLPADEGVIVVDGIDLTKIKKRDITAIRRKVGVIFQDYKLLPERTVAENIALGLEIMGKSRDEIASRVGDLLRLIEMPEKENVFPSQLSGGEAQRVCIARALAIAPRVIFADEPTGNLDDTTGMTIALLLSKLNQLGTTILMATHNSEIVKHMKKRTIHIENGQVVLDTPAPKKEKEEKKEVK